jgi:hypothetical protein
VPLSSLDLAPHARLVTLGIKSSSTFEPLVKGVKRHLLTFISPPRSQLPITGILLEEITSTEAISGFADLNGKYVVHATYSRVPARDQQLISQRAPHYRDILEFLALV